MSCGVVSFESENKTISSPNPVDPIGDFEKVTTSSTISNISTQDFSLLGEVKPIFLGKAALTEKYIRFFGTGDPRRVDGVPDNEFFYESERLGTYSVYADLRSAKFPKEYNPTRMLDVDMIYFKELRKAVSLACRNQIYHEASTGETRIMESRVYIENHITEERINLLMTRAFGYPPEPGTFHRGAKSLFDAFYATPDPGASNYHLQIRDSFILLCTAILTDLRAISL